MNMFYDDDLIIGIVPKKVKKEQKKIWKYIT